jgi:hypothetical protein
VAETEIELRIQDAPDGAARHERVPADDLGAGRYRLINSPGLVLGVAAGDEVLVGLDGAFEVDKRGGNVAIQLFCDQVSDGVALRAALIQALLPIGGWLDGDAGAALVYTVPQLAGVAAIVGAMEQVSAEFPDLVWMFGNVDVAREGEEGEGP